MAYSPAIQAAAELSKPPFIHSVGLEHLSLGAAPPRVEALRVRPLASAAVQSTAAAAVATAMARTQQEGGVSQNEPITGGGEDVARFRFRGATPTSPTTTVGPPSIAAASVSSPQATTVNQTPAAATGVVLSEVTDVTVASVAVAIAVQEQVGGDAGDVSKQAAAVAAAGDDSTVGGSARSPVVGVEGIEVEVDFIWRGDPVIALFVEAYLPPG